MAKYRSPLLQQRRQFDAGADLACKINWGDFSIIW